MPHKDKPKVSEREAKDAFTMYSEYNKTVRTWFVTFGIGGPALIVANSDVANALALSNNESWIIVWFLVGCTSQVAIALINKFGSWYTYDTGENPGKTGCWRCLWVWVYKQFGFDLFFDGLTLLAFSCAIILFASATLTF